MKTQNIIIFVVILVLIIAGISFLSKGELSPNTAVTNTESAQTAPNFSLEDLSGNTITLADYKGVKSVVLDFWATWCPNCQRDMPRLNSYYEKYKDQVEVIGVNLQENKNLVEKFVQQKGLTFPIVLDPTGLVSRNYSVRYTNYHVVIDKEGNVVRTIPGDISESDIQSLIN
ncbi:MAG: redoxin domain-containing protein [Candidatus Zambryskibacteria bacterium]|nr:redoxin domain-containing protein [Candidatus Zambryskibacteria bacterium]